MKHCLNDYFKCIKELNPIQWELQCTDKILLCLKLNKNEY